MTKGRTTTFEEHVQTVMDCIQYGKDYQRIMETHWISYQQIYSWEESSRRTESTH